MFINSNKKLKKVLIIALVMALTYSNFLLVGINGIKGLFSYAFDDDENESLELNIANQEIINFSKSNIEYEENWTASIKTISSNKLTIEQEENRFLDSEDNELNTFKTSYKTTSINKDSLLELLGTKGELSIYNKDNDELIATVAKSSIEELSAEITLNSALPNVTLDNENEIINAVNEQNTNLVNNNENINAINEQNSVTTINTDTVNLVSEHNDVIEIQSNTLDLSKELIVINDNNVVVNYPDGVNSIYLEITNIDHNKETSFTFNHNKVLSVVVDEQEEITDEVVLSTFENLKKLESKINGELSGTNNSTTYEYTIKNIVTKPFTKAKMGINKSNLSISNANDVIITLTLYTEREGYNLFNNPAFEIELPNYVENVSVNSVDILNNQREDETLIFTQNNRVENNKILINLIGTQEEHTTVPSENVQVVINATIKTKELMPTTEDLITLRYANNEERREVASQVKFETDEIVITALKATAGAQMATSKNNDYKTISIDENEEQKVLLAGTVINNTQNDLESAKILGHGEFIGEINVENATVYYSQNKDATEDIDDEQNAWTSEYTQNAKAYLMVLDISQKQTVDFSYEMTLPTNITEDQVYNVSYDVLNNQNEKMAGTKIEINQETSLDNNLNSEAENESISMSLNTRILDTTYDQEFESASLGSVVEYVANIKNKTENDIDNVTLEINLSNDFDEQVINIHINEKDNIENCQLAYYYSPNDHSIFKETNCGLYISDKKITITGVYLQANKEYELAIHALVENREKEMANTIIKLSNEDEVLRVKSEVPVNNPLVVNATIISDKMNQNLNFGDNIEFTLEVSAEGQGYADVEIEPVVDSLLKVTKYTSITVDTTETEEDHTINLLASEDEEGIENLSQKVRLTTDKKITINVFANVGKTGENTQITTFANVTGQTIENVRTNILTNIINATPGYEIVPGTDIEDGNEDQTNPNSDEPDNPGQQTQPEEDNTYSISGVAWLDENKNGQREESEKLLPNIEIKLFNLPENELVKTGKTSEKGQYSFKNLENGNYYLVFEYDNITYSLTEYNKAGVQENLNSDVILTTENNKNTSKTNTLIIKNSDLTNIDIGLVENELVDLEINKYINKVVVSNTDGTTTYDYNKAKTANVSIGRKVFDGSTVVVEYEIDITNKGDIPTYAKSVKDILPQELTFNTELNNSWFKDNDGTLQSVELAQEVINPGETKTIILIASIVTKDKAQTLVNNAKIGEMFNSKLIQEKDTKNNESQASLLITVNTGNERIYVGLLIATITIISAGIMVINKRILSKK